jgi:butyrate kinase
MKDKKTTLIINPGSTSTKIFVKNLSHSNEELDGFEKITDQYEFRSKIISTALAENNIAVSELSAVVGRGGLLKPIPGGTYEVCDNMVKDLKKGILGDHASNLGGILAYNIAKDANCKSFIVDPVVVDEMNDIARLSGNPNIPRISIFHALNQKSVARQAAKELGKKYENSNFIVAHMGGGISVGVHENGRVIDVNNGLDGDGPYTPERSGGLPAGGLVKLCFSGDFTQAEIKKQIKGAGGLVAYLGTNDAREVERRYKEGDPEAILIYSGMAYQIAKEIGLLATVVKGKVDAIVLTGGVAYDKDFTNLIKERVSFISDVMVYPGEHELEALRDGALRILNGEEEPKTYA